MITPENAKKQLESWQVDEEGKDRFLPAVKKLPGKLRGVAYALLRRDAKGQPILHHDWPQELKVLHQALLEFDGLGAKQRIKLFTTLLCKLAPSTETAWQFLRNSTYQRGYARKSFRAPGYSEATIGSRGDWLQSMIAVACNYRPEVLTVPWLAAWAPHLDYPADQDAIGRLLAAAIDAGGPQGDEVFDILCQSARNEHEIGAMGRHVSRALLMASRPEGWELIEKMLLAAQRQEGLRQVILETVDEAHPEAFRRMLRIKGGQALRGPRGKLEPVKKGETLRIAHAHDLLESGQWDKFQHECFQAERVQPFKQVFRELYVVTKQEKRDATVSRRYAGQQVQPKQAMALWGQRAWSTQDGVWKTFHDVGLTVSVCFRYGGGTPLDVEGLTIDGVQFHRRDQYEPMKLVDVPPRIFSEAMRDMDLVVSVAHRGGVDPEASASTVEMRASLLRETCMLLGMKNVRIKDTHVLIDGELGHYSVHLGSATVHRLPGGSICLVAVPAQHRGRLFLPFADDDPRTAEVIAKTVLLARDTEIQDPTILEQLRR